MNRLFAFSFFLFSWCLSLKAQSAKDFFYTEDYRHTINYDDHKAEFYTLPSINAPGFTNTEKKYYWYSNNHINITQGGFSGKLLDGLYSDFYLNKNLKEQGHFKKGLKDGSWKSWAENGLLTDEVHYRDGELNGRFIKYNINGEIAESGRYKSGRLNGRLKSYIAQDSVRIQYYKNGILQPVKKHKLNKILNRLFKRKDKSASRNKD